MNNHYQFEMFGEKSKFFFHKFPYVEYSLDGENRQKIRNFFKRFDFRENIRKYGPIFTKWIVRDDDTPEIIADKLYGSTHYYWIVLMINQIYDPFFGFPMKDREVFEYTNKKYGVDKIHDVHHYESVATADRTTLPEGIIVDDTYPHKKEITNLEYEVRENDRKRKILLLNPEYLGQVLNELETILESDFIRVQN